MYDLIIKNANLMDGSGSPAFKADLAVKGDSIVKIGDLSSAEAKESVDASGLTLAPGFIDLHTHSDMNLLIDGEAHSHILQGVTTVGVGNCGTSVAPLNKEMSEETNRLVKSYYPDAKPYEFSTVGEFFTELEKRGISQNMVFWVGQGSIRQYVMGFKGDKASAEELAAMKQQVKKAMDDGAIGVSTGLIYVPGVYAEREEIIELIKETAPYKGIYSSHIRGENDTVFDALNEAIDVARAAGVPLHVSHLKIMGSHMWGRSKEMLKLIEDAVASGVDVTFDQYPYKAGATGLNAVLPPWASIGGKEKLIERLKDPAERAKIRADISNPDGIDGWYSLWKGVGWENIMVTGFPPDKSLEGKSVAEIGKIWGMDGFDACFELILKKDGDRADIVIFSMGDEDIENIMKHPLQMVASDSIGQRAPGDPSEGQTHPRGFGTFVKVLGEYARERKVISMEEAVRKMTSTPAKRVGIKDRGLLKEGMKADLVLFDAKTVNSNGDYTNPRMYPTGIHKVWVNGVLASKGKEHTGARPGKVLKPLL
ncbi:MAG: D-aminoacylase [Treponema sp.]|nr:D-aminoacylase [Treponema sp.]